jgi:hypothetical protein
MANEGQPASLDGYARWCATSAVEAQRNFDAAYDAGGDYPLPRPRMRLGTYELKADLDLRVSRSVTIEISVRPVNLGFRLTRDMTTESHATLTVTVEQVAFPTRS